MIKADCTNFRNVRIEVMKSGCLFALELDLGHDENEVGVG